MYVGDISHIDHGTVDRFDRQVGHVLDIDNCVVQIDGVFQRVDFLRADRNDDVLCCQCIGHILCTQTQRLQFRQLKVNLYQTHLAAVGKRNGCTRHRDQRCAHQVQAIVGQVLFRQTFAGQGQLQNRHR